MKIKNKIYISKLFDHKFNLEDLITLINHPGQYGQQIVAIIKLKQDKNHIILQDDKTPALNYYVNYVIKEAIPKNYYAYIKNSKISYISLKYDYGDFVFGFEEHYRLFKEY